MSESAPLASPRERGEAAERSEAVRGILLADQIVEVEKEIRDRGRLLQETADAKLAALRAVQTTLTWLDANMHWIKPEAERRRAARRLEMEAASLREHPAVAPVLEAFPDASVSISEGKGAHA